MERIHGETTQEAWSTFGWYKSLRLAWQLRGFISSMRSITLGTSGSLVTGTCRSFWLDDRFGLPARATAKQVVDFLAFWIGFKSIRAEYKKSNLQHAALQRPESLGPQTMVFTHHDLAPRNIIVDQAGDAWLVDWDLAGHYRIYFEYASMSNFHIPKSWRSFARLRWRIVMWLAAGFYEKQSRQVWAIRSNFQRYPAGRRLNIKARVTVPRFLTVLESSSDTSDAGSTSIG